jgi:hypothetical protein
MPASEATTPTSTKRAKASGGDREVWLCCIPVAEILSESFRCADSPFPMLFGSSDYAKVRYCSLAHPTATEPTYIPLCIPAPLRAPALEG